ncbi:unnamed protein product [Nippostrongylus brasiliensis]|uniref:Secreted protein n=1 Tax=Nippostrongylus brasiliensis TaxID=27835 RepID=A0A0N4YST0_NIPBR|nr:hypothetical protein Q1695_009418 [Nippostrongylus brasiliensis]VDL84040.1 unnamed protein product [Nippostrongylus brasiliensis]
MLRYFHIAILCGLSTARTIRSAEDSKTEAPSTEPPPATILPVQHVREVQSGYLTMKDTQLGSGSAETDDSTSPPCVPRNSPEGIARLYILAKQMAEEADRKGVVQVKAPDPTPDPTPKPTNGDLPPVVDGPTKPPFNDTTPFNGIDVSEVMELRIVKPLCDY